VAVEVLACPVLAHRGARAGMPCCDLDVPQNPPHTLAVAIDLGTTLRALGERRAARELAKDTRWPGTPRPGEDHPDTLAASRARPDHRNEVGEDP
jgi:hypothetical protein